MLVLQSVHFAMLYCDWWGGGRGQEPFQEWGGTSPQSSGSCWLCCFLGAMPQGLRFRLCPSPRVQGSASQSVSGRKDWESVFWGCRKASWRYQEAVVWKPCSTPHTLKLWFVGMQSLRVKLHYWEGSGLKSWFSDAVARCFPYESLPTEWG